MKAEHRTFKIYYLPISFFIPPSPLSFTFFAQNACDPPV